MSARVCTDTVLPEYFIWCFLGSSANQVLKIVKPFDLLIVCPSFMHKDVLQCLIYNSKTQKQLMPQVMVYQHNTTLTQLLKNGICQPGKNNDSCNNKWLEQ